MYRTANALFAVVMLSLFALTSLMAHHNSGSALFSNPYMPLLVPLW
jgi:hypothetical protein